MFRRGLLPARISTISSGVAPPPFYAPADDNNFKLPHMQMPLIGLSQVPRHRQLYKMTEAGSRLVFGGQSCTLNFQ